MCLYPRLVINKKYKVTKKNGGNVPHLLDRRVQYVPIACGNCLECRRQKANEWRVRLNEEIKSHKYNYFITLTFNDESFIKLSNDVGLKLNDIATRAIRLFTERYRKKYKKAIRHWVITELGGNDTERLHFHGLLFMDFSINNDWLQDLWQYGFCDTGKYVNTRTINYIVKYITKIDILHKDYQQKIFCSKGIGKGYLSDNKKEYHKFKDKETKDFYTLPDGNKLALPIYYRNNLFSEEEREKLWIQKIEQDTRYVNGIKIHNASKNIEKLVKTLTEAQRNNYTLGFGDFSKEWNKKEYLLELDNIAPNGSTLSGADDEDIE